MSPTDHLDRAELVAVERIMAVDFATEAEGDAFLAEPERRVPHPLVSGLSFWPGGIDPEGGVHPEPTAEEVVDAALAYRPIALGPPDPSPDD